MTSLRVFTVTPSPLRLLRSLVTVLMCCASSWATSAHAGPFPDEIAAWTDATKDAQRAAGKKLLADIQTAVQRGDRVIQIEKGDYRFSELSAGKYPAHIVWEGWKDVTIDFQGSSFWFDHPRTGLKLIGCENVKLENLFLDWDPLPFMQGTVTAIQPKTGYLNVKLDDGYEDALCDRMRKADGKSKWRGFIFDRKSGHFKKGMVGIALNFYWDKTNEDGTYGVKFNGFYGVPLAESGLEVGDPIVILSRMGRAIRSEHLRNCVFEDVTLYSSPFVAFASWGGSGTVYRRCNILRRPGTNRWMGGNADGINCANMEQGPLIEDCVIENIGDDFVNVHASLARVIGQESPTQIVSSILNSRDKVEQPITLEFYERTTMKPLGTRRVKRVELIPEWTIDEATCTADLKHRWHSGDAAALRYGATVKAHRIVLEDAFEVAGDVIAVCPEFSSSGAIIRNNRFAGSPAKGIRQQAPNVLIENNEVSYTGGAGLSLFGQPSYWGEGPYVFNARVLNNFFHNTVISKDALSSGAIIVREVGYRSNQLSRNVIIRGNRIENTGGSGIIAAGVDGLQIVENTVLGYARYPSFTGDRELKPGTNYGLVIDSSSKVIEQANRVAGAGPYSEGERYFDDVDFQE